MKHNDYDTHLVELSKEFLSEFGYILELKSGVNYITLGDHVPRYISKYLSELSRTMNAYIDKVAITIDENESDDWNFIEIEDYEKKFPKDVSDHNYDIVAMYKAKIRFDDIDTVEKLKKVFKNYKLKGQ